MGNACCKLDSDYDGYYYDYDGYYYDIVVDNRGPKAAKKLIIPAKTKAQEAPAGGQKSLTADGITPNINATTDDGPSSTQKKQPVLSRTLLYIPAVGSVICGDEPGAKEMTYHNLEPRPHNNIYEHLAQGRAKMNALESPQRGNTGFIEKPSKLNSQQNLTISKDMTPKLVWDHQTVSSNSTISGSKQQFPAKRTKAETSLKGWSRHSSSVNPAPPAPVSPNEELVYSFQYAFPAMIMGQQLVIQQQQQLQYMLSQQMLNRQRNMSIPESTNTIQQVAPPTRSAPQRRNSTVSRRKNSSTIGDQLASSSLPGSIDQAQKVYIELLEKYKHCYPKV